MTPENQLLREIITAFDCRGGGYTSPRVTKVHEWTTRFHALTQPAQPASQEPFYQLGAAMSWGGFNLYGNPESIVEARRLKHEADKVPELMARIRAGQEQAQQPSAEHEKDCATCAHQALPAYANKCQQCNRLATGARRNWQAQQPSGGEVVAVPGTVYVDVSGFTGTGKSAVAGEIEIAMRAIGLQVEWVDGQAEKNMTGADWAHALEMYKPRVVIRERNIPLTLAAPPAEGRDIKAAPVESYPAQDQAFHTFWYSHMQGDLMQPPLAGVSHSTARYIWDSALATPKPEPMTEEQIAEMARQEEFLLVCDGIEELRDITRAVEAHHGITKGEA